MFVARPIKLLPSLVLAELQLVEGVAKGMSVILHDLAALAREAHAACGPSSLYQQRFFVQDLPHLMALLDGLSPASPAIAASTAASTRFVVLLSLSHLLRHLPHSVLFASLPTLLPLLLQSLSSAHSELRVATLETVTSLLREDVTCMSAHLSTLLPALLELI